MPCGEDDGAPLARPPLVIEVTQRPGSTVIALAGELDLCTSHLLPPLLDTPLAGAAEVAVDAAAVRFLDVRGWRALHGMIDGFRQQGHRAWLVNASPQVERMARLLESVDDRLSHVDEAGPPP